MNNRLDLLKEEIFAQYAKIRFLPMLCEAFEHTVTVMNFCALLAEKRNCPPELAIAAGLLHDYAKFAANQAHDHAAAGAQLARTILIESRSFTEEEIDAICDAIANHSDKNRTDAPLDEILKDADVLARSVCDPAGLLSVSRRSRLMRARKDLSLPAEMQA